MLFRSDDREAARERLGERTRTGVLDQRLRRGRGGRGVCVRMVVIMRVIVVVRMAVIVIMVVAMIVIVVVIVGRFLGHATITFCPSAARRP